MPQKMVVKVHMNDDKCRSKALKIVVGIYGVTSAALGKKDKSQIEVIGEGVDPVKLTSSLRKKLGKGPHITCLYPNEKAYAELISVSQVKDEKKDDPPKIVWTYGNHMPPVFYPEVVRDPDPFPCSIM